jgi:hypothetical protein
MLMLTEKLITENLNVGFLDGVIQFGAVICTVPTENLCVKLKLESRRVG